MNSQSELHLKRNILAPSIILQLVIVIAAFFVVYSLQSRDIQHETQSRLNAFSEVWQTTLGLESEKIKGLLSFLDRDEDLQQIWLRRDREELYRYSSEIFQRIKSDYQITHFYFIDLEGRVFLRVHNPKRFGDKVGRWTMLKAKENQSLASGIELGTYGHFTLRVVKPCFVDGQLVGYLELGEEIEHIIPNIRKILEADLFLVVNKSLVDYENWLMVGGDNQTPDHWKQFERQLLIAKTASELPLAIRDSISNNDNSLKVFQQDGLTMHLGNTEVQDASGEIVGSVYLQRDVTADRQRLEGFMLIFTLLAMLLGVITAWFLYRQTQRSENEIKKGRLVIESKNKELQQSLSETRQANKAKSELIANISHEIRTPMNGIVGAAELLKDESKTPEQKTYTDLIASSAQNLLHLINDLLDISKIESGKLTLEKEAFNLSNIISNVELLMAERATAKNLELISDISAIKDKQFIGDPSRVQQIITNIVGNAIKFTEQGSVRVVTQLDDSFREADKTVLVKIIIADTGIGIEPEYIDQLFSRFVQADSSITRRFGGTGLGLAISKQLTQMMDGTINVSSQPGKGSEFIVEIPFEIAPSQSPIEESKPDLHRDYQRRVLLAEDNTVNQLVISEFLKKLGILVDIAQDGIEAFDQFCDGEFDLIMMDMQMPNMDGISACKLIRQLDEPKSKTPIIAMTANAMEADKRSCFEAGMNGFISKPVYMNDLVNELDKWLDS